MYLVFLFTIYIRMNGKCINCDNKNTKKSDFHNKNKKFYLVQMILMLIKY